MIYQYISTVIIFVIRTRRFESKMLASTV